ncbi:hypothetical protein AB0H00_02170 [Nocardia sp. NPDC023852]|uniref:hypothetical protein n=1 Tax=Nocardia sp. NPDC023852 TaxID=3154697 RepID=UPI0033DD9222
MSDPTCHDRSVTGLRPVSTGGCFAFARPGAGLMADYVRLRRQAAASPSPGPARAQWRTMSGRAH